jgi:hypothetical protein
MEPKTWDELVEDCQRRYQEFAEADRHFAGRHWAESLLALAEIIALVRGHFSFEDIRPVISHAALVFLMPNKRFPISVYCKGPGLPIRVSYSRSQSPYFSDKVEIEKTALIPTLRNYIEMLQNMANE